MRAFAYSRWLETLLGAQPRSHHPLRMILRPEPLFGRPFIRIG
jgi:hypothetical protein